MSKDTETPTTEAEVAVEATADPTVVVETTAEPVFDPEAAYRDQQATNEQMANLLTQQSEAMQGMQAAIQGMAKPAAPATEEEYADPTEKALAGMQAQLNRIEGRTTEKDNAAYVDRCTVAAGEEVDKLIAKNSLTKANSALAKKIRKQVVTGTRNHVVVDPANRTVTAQQVHAAFNLEMQEQQAVFDSMPGQKAESAAEQAKINAKSKEMPGGVSPAQEPDKPLHPDTDAFWALKSEQETAAFTRMGEP